MTTDAQFLYCLYEIIQGMFDGLLKADLPLSKVHLTNSKTHLLKILEIRVNNEQNFAFAKPKLLDY